MFQFFKKQATTELAAVVAGEIIELEKVNDPIFAQKMMGEGIAIIPSATQIVAPCDAEVIVLPKSKHAVGLKTAKNQELLIHVGIDTVELQGEGFEVHTSIGQQVKKGEPLISFAPAYLTQEMIDMTTMLIILNTQQARIEVKNKNQTVQAGQDIVIVMHER